MSRKVILSTAYSNRRQPLLQESESYRKAGTRLGEAVGGTAAVCCCCSFGLANIVYLAVCKVPASLCHKALQKKRRRRRIQSMKEGLVPAQRRCTCGCCDDIIGTGRVYPLCYDDADLALFPGRCSLDKDTDVVQLEKEMWDRFYGSGFWRSPSQRDDSSISSSQRISSSSAPNLHVLAVN